MKLIVENLRSLFHDETGATAIEYALIAGLIVIGLVAGISSIGGSTQTDFQSVRAGFNN